jgi:MFS family permease
LNQPDRKLQARSLFSFCALHFIDDGFTDAFYILLPFIAAELSLSFSEVGLLTGVFSGAMSLLQFPLSLLGERIGELVVVGAGTFGLAAGFLLLGRVYSFPLVFKEKTHARYVRFTCTPLDGKGFGLSELQVFDHVEVKPWPAEIWLPEVALTRRQP